MSNADRRRDFTSLVLVRKGASIPTIPEEFARFVRIERVQGLNKHEISIEHDEWLVTNAKAGFTGRGSFRLEDKKGNVRTWISGIDMQKILGHDGDGKMHLNHRICFENGCGHRAIFHKEYFNQERNCQMVEYKCTYCGNVKEFPKRPASHKAVKHRKNKKNINHHPKTIRSYMPARLPVTYNKN